MLSLTRQAQKSEYFIIPLIYLGKSDSERQKASKLDNGVNTSETCELEIVSD